MTKRVVLIASVLLFAATASADFVAEGDPIEGGSWTQWFQESGVGQFDFMAVRMTSADCFESPTMSSLASGWVNTDATAKRAYAEGPAVTNMTFPIHFAGDRTDPLEFEFFAFNGETLVEAANAAWSGSSWNITLSSATPTRGDLTMVPLPGAALLGLIGLTAIAALKRRT